MQNKNNFPFVNKNQTKVILSQLEKCICRIIKGVGNTGTGSFCKFPYPDQFHLLPVLITNNHVLDENCLKKYCNIRFTINDDNIDKNIIIDGSRLVFTDKEIDITIIEIKPYDKIIHFLDIDEDILNEQENANKSYENSQIYILQYPSGKKASHALGVVNNIVDFNIHFFCNTDFGSSGSPILLLSKFKLIGVHRGKIQNFKFNKGTLIKIAIDKFNSQKQFLVGLSNKNNILNLKKIELQYLQDYFAGRINDIQLTRLLNSLYSNNYNNKTENKNIIEMTLCNTEEVKDIYFLDNTSYTDENGANHYHDGLKELNESNVQLYINDLETKFKKHYIFSRANYKIKMIFKTKMTNCKNMFYDCSNLVKIDLSSFDTTNVTDMSGMFNGCMNLKNLNLSSLNTENVTDMSYMFCGCCLLENIDLSSFNTKKVKNMKGMFNSCFSYLFNPITLNLSNFDTRNVRNMEKMFRYCKSLKNIIFSPSFNTINVTSMRYMFNNCEQLVNLNLSFFDTRNVVNMYSMFEHCDNLENLDLSSFNTKNVTNMYAMFFCCGKLVSLDLSNFDTRNVTDMRCMFQSCSNLKSLNLSSFNANSVKKIKGMFSFCPSLNNVIFNDNKDSILIKNCYKDEHGKISMLDLLPSKIFFINPNIFQPPQNIIFPPAPNVLQPVNLPFPISPIVKPPLIVPNQDLYVQAPIANTPIMPKNNINFGINSVGNNIPYENIPVPMSAPYENNFALISAPTHDISSVRVNQYNNNVNMPNVRAYPIY